MRYPIRLLGVVGMLAVGGCGYQQQVAQPPLYCYQSLAAVTCLEGPYPRDERRLVNYIGPHPDRYPAPLRHRRSN